MGGGRDGERWRGGAWWEMGGGGELGEERRGWGGDGGGTYSHEFRMYHGASAWGGGSLCCRILAEQEVHAMIGSIPGQPREDLQFWRR